MVKYLVGFMIDCFYGEIFGGFYGEIFGGFYGCFYDEIFVFMVKYLMCLWYVFYLYHV